MLKKPILFALRTLTASLALFVLFGFKATEAHAVTTEIILRNNTQLTLSTPVVTNWNNQYWSACAGGASPNGPPATIAPGATVCLGTSASKGGLIPYGTGGTISYSIVFPYVASTIPLDSVSVTWSTPWASVPPVNAGGYTCGAYVTSCSGSTCNSGSLEDSFTNTCVGEYSGNLVEFEVDEAEVTASFAIKTTSGGLSGSAGETLSLVGGNIKPSAQVFFGSVNATTSCPNGTGCTVIVPQNSGVVPVTLTSYGTTTTIGNFSYLGTPNCQFSASDIQTSAVFAQCVTNPAADPVFIYSLNSAGAWNYVYDYPTTAPNNDDQVLSGVTPGSQVTLVGCTETEDGYINSEPGAPGCDNEATTLTIPLKFCQGLSCIHISATK